MKTYHVAIDGPPLVICGQIFHEGIELCGQPAYGRVLFTSHDSRIEHCDINAGPNDHCCILANYVRGVFVKDTTVNLPGVNLDWASTYETLD